MTEWISVKNRLPDKPGRIIVLIGDREFLGTAYNHDFGFRWKIEGDIEYEIPKTFHCDSEVSIKQGGGWKIASHFKEPTHWMHLPKAPHE